MKETVKKVLNNILENCHKFKNARDYHRHKYKDAELYLINFNRCKAIHPQLFLVLRMLHVEMFMESENLDMTEIIPDLEDYSKERTDNPHLLTETSQNLCIKYQKYVDETLEGAHGKTPEIFLKYTRLVEYYMILDDSIRIGNLDLSLYVLPKITNVFFSMNHHNYARYMTIYYDKLLNIEKTHPGLLAECKETFLGLRRTPKPHSRIPIDLTLEQTINANAASRATGVINFDK